MKSAFSDFFLNRAGENRFILGDYLKQYFKELLEPVIFNEKNT